MASASSSFSVRNPDARRLNVPLAAWVPTQPETKVNNYLVIQNSKLTLTLSLSLHILTGNFSLSMWHSHIALIYLPTGSSILSLLRSSQTPLVIKLEHTPITRASHGFARAQLAIYRTHYVDSFTPLCCVNLTSSMQKNQKIGLNVTYPLSPQVILKFHW